ncbi:MAG: glycosyltransferase family A protein [Selenomonadaceae bacterium]|nr:glycosyltransferase family A protein [Selenomonadaceae bacterium]
MNNNKKVSVIMPCYNDGKYIYESINSVFDSTYDNIELIIINDGSDDEYTLKILKELENKKNNLKILHSHNLKPAGARNLGIENATGEYIMPVDADDKIDKTYIEKAVKILNNNENIGVVYCKADLFGKKTGIWELPEFSKKAMLVDNVVFITALFRKKDWERIGGFRIDLKHGMEDYDFWLSMLEVNRDFYQINEILFHYRIKEQSRTTMFNDNIDNVKNTYKEIYYNHRSLYVNNQDEAFIALRETIIECSSKINMYDNFYRETIGIKRLLDKFPLIKKCIKQIIMR